MNWLDFIASIVGSVAWPVAIVISAWIFRTQIRALLPRLRLKHNETEISFRLEEAEKSVEGLPPPPPETPAETPEEKTRFEQLLAISPKSAMIDAYSEVEAAAKRAADTHIGELLPKTLSMRGIVRMLRNKEIIGNDTAAILYDLMAIRNAIAHDPNASASPDDARRFKSLADKAIIALDYP